MPRRRWPDRLARMLLPRAAVVRIGAMLAERKRRSDLKRLPAARENFDRAYAAYWRTGVVTPDAHELLFLATWSSGGTYALSRARELGRPMGVARYDQFPDDLLGRLDASVVARAVEENGFYVAPFRLPDDIVDDILEVLDAGPAEPRGDGLGDLPAGRPRPSAPTWWMHPAESLRSTAVRRLLSERRLAEAAGAYLGVDPLIMSVVLWKSFAWKSPDKRSAQHFHYDNDRSGFVKMFVHLTDIDETNGPHTYVPHSHRAKPTELMHGQRLTDAEVDRFFPSHTWRIITGPRGTVFFADTQGFHKGGHVATGERAIFQINLATDRFGVDEPPIGSAADAPPDMKPLVAVAPRFFSQLFTPERLIP